MNKPVGYVCSAASDSHKTVYELLSPELQELVRDAPRGSRLHTVGRLDCDTSGLLLLTNDGKFSNKITAGAVVETEDTVVECEPSERIENTADLCNVLHPGGFDTASGLLNHRGHPCYCTLALSLWIKSSLQTFTYKVEGDDCKTDCNKRINCLHWVNHNQFTCRIAQGSPACLWC